MSTVTRPTNYLPVRPVVSETVGAIPDVADLLKHELTVNIADEQLYAKDSSGALHKIISPRNFDVVDSSTSFGLSSFVRGKHQVSVRLNMASVTLTYDEGLPDGSIIDAGVSWENDPNELLIVVGDGSVEKFRNNRDVVEGGGIRSVKIESDCVFVKNGDFWDLIRGNCFCVDTSQPVIPTGMQFEGEAGVTASLTVTTSDGSDYSIDWRADGNPITYSSGSAATYDVDATGGVFDAEAVFAFTGSATPISFESTEGKWTFTAEQLNTFDSAKTLTTLTMIGDQTVLPDDLEAYTAASPKLIHVRSINSNTWSGDLATAFANLDDPESYFQFVDSNTFSGSLDALASNFSDSVLDSSLVVAGDNTAVGDVSVFLPLLSNSRLVNIKGDSLLTGDIAAGLAGNTQVTQFFIDGADPASNVVADISAITAAIPQVRTLSVTSSGTYSVPSQPVFNNTMVQIVIQPQSGTGLTSSEVDSIIIAADNITTWSGVMRLYLQGTNAAPTAAVAANITSLQGKGVTVQVN